LFATLAATSYSEKENKSPKCPGVILIDWGGFEPARKWRYHPYNPLFFDCYPTNA
jgi:hypothetical protein